jgi:hypothetical protein
MLFYLYQNSLGIINEWFEGKGANFNLRFHPVKIRIKELDNQQYAIQRNKSLLRSNDKP